MSIKTYITSTVIAISALTLTAMPAVNAEESAEKSYSLVIHGGAGNITRDKTSPEKQAAIEKELHKALKAGQDILASGGDALDAIAASIMIMENSAYFNAGRGAVFTADGTNEMDASIMDGRDLNAGAIAGVTIVKNPITLARAVMDKSKHVMLQSKGAERFARQVGVEIVDPKYFFTQKRYDQMRKAQADKKTSILMSDYKYGTVGAVALDSKGNIAAGTSTGGMTNKMYGRVGDVPIIGAGTYANNESCGVSATGHGEYFIRATVARNICALMEYAGLSLQEATDKVVQDQLVKMKGAGGIIAVDKDGNMIFNFNTPGMYRGKVGHNTAAEVGMFKD